MSEARDALDGGSFDEIRFDEKDLVEIAPGLWQVDIPFSYQGAENVAEGDLEDDIAPAFPTLMRAKSIYGAEYEFHVVVGGKHANPFGLRSHIIAMIAALGGSLLIHRQNDNSHDSAKQARIGPSPARSESKAEDGVKPQPQSEGCSQ